jgi:carbonyl reductase 1
LAVPIQAEYRRRVSKVAIVTGANQGLGLAVVRRLAGQLGPDGVVYLTARRPDRGRAAASMLRAAGLHATAHRLDVTDERSVPAFAEVIADRHGGVDIVVSNAAARISPDRSPAAQVRQFVDTNNFGTIRMIEAFGPLLKDGGRYVVVASAFGTLEHLPPHLHDAFDPASRTLDEIAGVMDEYVRLVERGHAADAGWPDWINIPSKVGQVAAMKILARELCDDARTRDLLINAACPGLVDTAASRPWFADMSGAQTPDEAAIDVAWLATLPPQTEDPNGELVQHRRVLPFQ